MIEDKKNWLRIDAPNIDQISQLLHEQVSGFREALVALLKKEHEQGATIMVSLDIDLDSLYKLNNDLGHLEANKAIKLFADHLQDRLDRIQEDNENICFCVLYKPQAGGDEFKVMLTLKQNSVDLIEKIITTLSKTVIYQDKEGIKHTMTGSVVSADTNLSGDDDSLFDSLEFVETECDQKMTKVKLQKIQQALTKTAKKGLAMTSADYLTMVTTIWGNRRIPGEILLALMEPWGRKLLREVALSEAQAESRQAYQ